MAGTSLHRFDVMTPKMISPGICLCNGQPHQLHRKFWLSKCSFMTRNGLHKNYVMIRKLLRQDFSYVCSHIVVFLRGGVLFIGHQSAHVTEQRWQYEQPCCLRCCEAREEHQALLQIELSLMSREHVSERPS